MSLFSSSAGLRGSSHCPPTAVCLPLSFLPPESSIAFTPAPHPALSFSRTPGTPHARASARAGPSARSAPPQKSMAPTLLQVFFFLLKCHLSHEVFLPHDLSLCFAFFFSFALNTNGTHCICY